MSIQAQIINLLKELKDDFNLTFLFISHDLSVIKYLSDRIAIMYLGEIIEIGKTEEIFSAPKHPYTKALLSSVPELNTNEDKEKIQSTNRYFLSQMFLVLCLGKSQNRSRKVLR